MAWAGVARQQVGVGRLDLESSLIDELIRGGEGEAMAVVDEALGGALGEGRPWQAGGGG